MFSTIKRNISLGSTRLTSWQLKSLWNVGQIMTGYEIIIGSSYGTVQHFALSWSCHWIFEKMWDNKRIVDVQFLNAHIIWWHWYWSVLFSQPRRKMFMDNFMHNNPMGYFRLLFRCRNQLFFSFTFTTNMAFTPVSATLQQLLWVLCENSQILSWHPHFPLTAIS